VALAEPLDDAGLVVGVLAGQRHAMAATGGCWRLPWRLTDHHAAPADGAVAIHPLDVFLQQSCCEQGFSFTDASQPGQQGSHIAEMLKK
jgi:hypothetical protein